MWLLSRIDSHFNILYTNQVSRRYMQGQSRLPRDKKCRRTDRQINRWLSALYTVQLISNLMLASARKTTTRHGRSKTRE